MYVVLFFASSSSFFPHLFFFFLHIYIASRLYFLFITNASKNNRLALSLSKAFQLHCRQKIHLSNISCDTFIFSRMLVLVHSSETEICILRVIPFSFLFTRTSDRGCKKKIAEQNRLVSSQYLHAALTFSYTAYIFVAQSQFSFLLFERCDWLKLLSNQPMK